MTDYQPNSHYCFVCGLKNKAGLRIRFQNDGDGQVRVETQICDDHQGFPGIAHGGISATILDETMGRAGLSGHPDRLFFTGKMEIKYRHNVPLNTDLVITARILKDRGRIATASGEITLPDGTVAVEGSATLVRVPPREIDAMLQHPNTGWQVYTEDEYQAAIEALTHE